MPGNYFNIQGGTATTVTNSGTTQQEVTQTRTEQGTTTSSRTSTTTEAGNSTTTENRAQNSNRNATVINQRALTTAQVSNEAQTVLADIGGQVTFKVLFRGKLGTVPPGITPPTFLLNAQTS